jgi:hypothetical protein
MSKSYQIKKKLIIIAGTGADMKNLYIQDLQVLFKSFLIVIYFFFTKYKEK